MVPRLNAEKWNTVKPVHAAAVLAIVAAVIMLPAFVLGTWKAHSAPNNMAWIDGIAAEMRQGWVYPRWLSSGFNGLGSPSFYFYPPLPFLIMGGARAVAGDWLSANAILQAYGFLLLFASGLAMWAWTRGFMTPAAALLSAIVYMLMPYHVFNFATRGAVGEFSAYAILPLLLLAAGRIGRGERVGVPIFAVLYALLIMTHLPASLLASVFVIPAYALWLYGFGPGAVGRLVRLGVAALLGIGLSAAYLVPALGLQEHINGQYWWNGHFDIRGWMIWELVHRREPFFHVLYVYYALYGLVLLYLWKGMPAGTPERRLGAFLLIWAWGMMLAVAGVVPQIWTGVLAKVQFPWRLLFAVDLVMAVLVVLAAGYHRAGRGVILLCFLVTVLVFAVPNIIFMLRGYEARDGFGTREPHEYRAAGYVKSAVDPPAGLMIPADAGTVRTAWEGERMVIDVSARRAARAVVPLNFFPA